MTRWFSWFVVLLVCYFALYYNEVAAKDGVGYITMKQGQLYRDGQAWMPKGFTYVRFSRPAPGRPVSVVPWPKLIAMQMKVFNADTIRVQVSQASLDPLSSKYSPRFLSQLVEAISSARSAGVNVILSMQWQRQGVSPELNSVPTDGTERAWQALATQFNSDLGIMYEIYNEPIGHGSGLARGWEGWRNSMQRLVDVIRFTGSRNVLIVEGKNSGHILTGAPALDDPQNALAFAVHPYPVAYGNRGYSSLSVEDWDRNFGEFCRLNHVCMVTEWATSSATKCRSNADGIDTPSVARAFINYLRENRIALAGAWAFDYVKPMYTTDYESFQPNSFEGNFKCDRNMPVQGPGELLLELWKN